jgi:hypothetical protein
MNALLLKKGRPDSVCSLIIEGNTCAAQSIRNPYLQSHVRALTRMIDRDLGKAKPLLPWLARLAPVVELKTPLLTQVRREVLNTVPVLIRLAAHHRDWLRDPETWRPDLNRSPREVLVSLIEHLLTEYAMPHFAGNAWFIDGPLSHIEREWYCHLGRGGNLRTFRGWNPRISRRASHEFLSAPDHLQMREALRYGQAQAILKDRSLAVAIAKSRIGLDFHHDEIWLPIFGMWANSGRTHEEFFLVADYLWAQVEEKGSTGVRLSGRDFPGLIRSAIRFFEELAKSDSRNERMRMPGCQLTPSNRNFLLDGRFRQWDPLDGVGPYAVEKSGWRYEISELNKAADLVAEGKDMSHCVGGFGRQCRSGSSAIFSLKSGDLEDGILDREVTMEVSRVSRRLVQARAWSNHHPHPVTRRVILDWCRENEIDASVLQR